jgi:hypothetical protein
MSNAPETERQTDGFDQSRAMPWPRSGVNVDRREARIHSRVGHQDALDVFDLNL